MAWFGAVIFDCDGVLVDSEALAIEAELALLAESGLAYDRSEFVTRFLGAPDVDFEAALEADSRARLGRSLPADFLSLVSRARREAYAGRLGEVPGAARAVAAVRGQKAVASSSRVALLRDKLEMTGLAPLFAPHIYSTEQVARGKPAPDIFLFAAERLGVEPRNCLVIEDSLNGVRAGRAAGMAVWGFIGGGHCDAAFGEQLRKAGAERIIGDWGEAENLFAGTADDAA